MSASPTAASWHPAMMPNSSVDLEHKITHNASNQPHNRQPGAAESGAPTLTHPTSHLPSSPNRTSDEWFPQYSPRFDNAAHDANSTESTTTRPSVETPDAHLETATQTSPHDASHAIMQHEHPHNNQGDQDHYARPHSETTSAAQANPSEYMPPLTQTNPSPPVPPHKSSTGHYPFPPGPSPLAEVSLPQEPIDNDLLPDIDDKESHHHHYQSICGNLQTTKEGDIDARYAEDSPLLPQGHAQLDNHDPPSQTFDPFAQATENAEYDFFSRIHEPSDSTHLDPNPQESLERKSTNDALNAMKFGETRDTSDEPMNNMPPKETATSDDQPAGSEDLDAKWKAMFTGDDELLLDDDSNETNQIGPSAFIGDDDDELLDDDDEQAKGPSHQPAQDSSAAVKQTTRQPNSNWQVSQSAPHLSVPQTLPFAPPTRAATFQPVLQPPASSLLPALVPQSSSSATAPPRPGMNRAQSFTAQPKGGYQSLYGLPMEVAKPRKRSEMQKTQRTASAQIAPNASLAPLSARNITAPGVAAPPGSLLTSSRSSSSLPGRNGARNVPSSSSTSIGSKSLPQPPHDSFFQDLPVTTKPRLASRHNSQSPRPADGQLGLNGPPASHVPPPLRGSSPFSRPLLSTTNAFSLHAPNERSAPQNAALQPSPSLTSHPPPAASSRYSPAPPPVSYVNSAPPAASSRYSPAPPPPTLHPVPSAGGYEPGSATASPSSALAYLPRASSPLMKFEHSRDRSRLPHTDSRESQATKERRASVAFDARHPLVPSLPPTREVEEEDKIAIDSPLERLSPVDRGSNVKLPYRPGQAPPPPLNTYSSPSKRTSTQYVPSLTRTSSFEAKPPPRSQTQSPGSRFGSRAAMTGAQLARPSSVNGHSSAHPQAILDPSSRRQSPPGPAMPYAPRQPRRISFDTTLIPPTDGRQFDPLERWKGAPVISWGIGGSFVVSHPKSTPRYGVGSAKPVVVRNPGEVKIDHIRNIEPLDERFASFPGPLKGKSKKKEVLAWLTDTLKHLQASDPGPWRSDMSHDELRAMERILLWRLLKVFLEFDGTLEGNLAVEQSVRDVLFRPSDLPPTQVLSPLQEGYVPVRPSTAPLPSNSADTAAAIDQVKAHLMVGDREKAVWAAADSRLWGHAFLIAQSASGDLYQKVTQEFLSKDVNLPGHGNESLATLYAVLSGNHEESIDQLVPVHARAGLQLVAKDSGGSGGAAVDALANMEKWRDTLALILGNRSVDDSRSLRSLGALLASYGRAEAAHICFLFGRASSVFSGLDDPQADIVLVGGDHRGQAAHFAKDTESLLLSELYEFGLSLAAPSSNAPPIPHLAAYKLQHALTLAEQGYADKALQYCRVVADSMSSQTKRFAYHHNVLEAATENLIARLRLAPKAGSGSWIAKPSMNKVSDSMWNRFNKFVSGDDSEESANRAPGKGDIGPFAQIAGDALTISSPHSITARSGLDFIAGIPPHVIGAAAAPPPSMPMRTMASGASRYAPAPASNHSAAYPTTRVGSFEMGQSPSPYAPPMEQSLSSQTKGSIALTRQSSETNLTNGYTPYNSSPAQTFHPMSFSGPPATPIETTNSHAQALARPPAQSAPTTPWDGHDRPRAIPHTNESQPIPQDSREEKVAINTGYQAPSYGYEPPSLTSYETPLVEGDAPEETKHKGASLSGGYEPPSYQPYTYEPPSLSAEPPEDEEEGNSDSELKPRLKKKGIMYDDSDDEFMMATKPAQKSQTEIDRENNEIVRKMVEEEAKRDVNQKEVAAKKKGWGLGSWFGGGNKDGSLDSTANKPIRAKLGEKNSFYYDPDQKRWINGAAGAEDTGPKKATPPPPKGIPHSASSIQLRPPTSSSNMDMPSGLKPNSGRSSVPPPSSMTDPRPTPSAGPPLPLAGPPAATLTASGPAMMRSVSNASNASAPPSRPPTSMSNTSSIDDLLGGAGPRAKPGARKARKGGRYVDVMANAK